MQSLKKISVLGVITGSIVATFGRNIVVFVIGIFIGIFLAASGAEVPADMGYTNPLASITFLVSSLFSILGGYLAAYLAKHDELLNGVLSSFLPQLFINCTLFSDPLYLAILTLITSPLLALLGGYLRLRQKSGKQKEHSGLNLETDPHPHATQPEHTPIYQGIKTRRQTGELSPLIRLAGIVIVVGVIWSLWFVWSLDAFTGPCVIILLIYGVFRLFRKSNPHPTDGPQE